MMNASPRIFVDWFADSCWFSRPGPARDFAIRHGITFEDDPGSADIVVGDRIGRLRRIGLKHPGKSFLLWTQEPRYDINTNRNSFLFGFFKPVRIMNVYTGNVFMSNTGLWGHRIVAKLFSDDVRSAFRRKTRNAVIIAGYQSARTDLVIRGMNVDLYKARQEIALALNRLGTCDIYGKNWPEIRSLAASREGNWKVSKDNILKEYRYNLCLENTGYPFYCTEKIWDSIRNSCIPIYTGKNNRIYNNFAPDSFVDISRFPDSSELNDYILGLSQRDAERRLMRCVDAYNAAHSERFEHSPNTAEEVVLKFVESTKSL